MGGLVWILSILSLRECRMCCHQSKPRTIWCSAAMSGSNILQTPRKTYLSSDSGNPSRWRLCMVQWRTVLIVKISIRRMENCTPRLRLCLLCMEDLWLIFASEWSAGLLNGDEIILESSGPFNWSLKTKVTSKGAINWIYLRPKGG